MQLTLNCPCGANANMTLNNENHYTNLEFMKEVYRTFMKEHKGHGNITHQSIDGFIREDEMIINN
jgi:hypothetical protein